MDGGAGDNVYHVDADDQVVDSGASLDDEIVAGGSYDLTGTNVEHLTLTGDGNTTGTGTNTANNRLTEDAGDDSLDGGRGPDHLSGGAGNDIYVVDTADNVVELADGGDADEI